MKVSMSIIDEKEENEKSKKYLAQMLGGEGHFLSNEKRKAILIFSFLRFA